MSKNDERNRHPRLGSESRRYKADYETHQVCIPIPIAPPVHSLIERYQDYLATGGELENPLQFLDRGESNEIL